MRAAEPAGEGGARQERVRMKPQNGFVCFVSWPRVTLHEVPQAWFHQEDNGKGSAAAGSDAEILGDAAAAARSENARQKRLMRRASFAFH